jgi:hypothetical protein
MRKKKLQFNEMSMALMSDDKERDRYKINGSRRSEKKSFLRKPNASPRSPMIRETQARYATFSDDAAMCSRSSGFRCFGFYDRLEGFFTSLTKASQPTESF